jgi:DNA-binding FadR family transcriptional regulator
VSRTRIRQVLIRLAGEDLVTLVPNGGARAAEPTSDEVREIFGARRRIGFSNALFPGPWRPKHGPRRLCVGH